MLDLFSEIIGVGHILEILGYPRIRLVIIGAQLQIKLVSVEDWKWASLEVGVGNWRNL